MKTLIAISSFLSLATAVTVAHYAEEGCSGDFALKTDGEPNVCTNINLGDCCGESLTFGSAVAGSFDDTPPVAANLVAYSQQASTNNPCQIFVEQVAMDQDNTKYVCVNAEDAISGGSVIASGGAKARRGVRRAPNGHSLVVGDVMYIVEGRDSPKAREYVALKTREEKRDYMERNADRITKIDFRA